MTKFRVGLVALVMVMFLFICWMRGVEKGLRIRQIVALEEIALNTGEIAVAIDNHSDSIYHYVNEVFGELDKKLPAWAWGKEK